jgi:hypothetical protein
MRGITFHLVLLCLLLPSGMASAASRTIALAPAATDRSIQHEISGVTMLFEERSIDFSSLMAQGDSADIRRTKSGHLATTSSEPAPLISPVYEVPIENPEPWLDVVALWKITTGDAHAITIELQGSTDGETWADWQPIRCMCCGAREVEENTIVSQLNTMDAATRFVRFRVLWPVDGEAVELEWVKLHFISPGASPPEMLAPPRATTSSEIGTLAVARPAVVSRASWGCPDGDGSRWAPSYANFTHLTVHHTVTSNSDTDWAARVRAIWNQHAISQNWGDIGYHFLVAGNGTIYQGRSGALTGDPIAAHVGGHNTRNMGVSMMGDFTSVLPTTAARNSLANILAWKADQRGINPLGSSTHASSGRFMPNITGHRDWAATACPGNTFYPTLPTVRDNVNTLINGAGIPAPTAPTSAAATDITSSSFRANWSSAANATEYLLDVSLTNTFSSFISGYNNRNVGNVTTFNVTGLAEATRYHYRVRARNTTGTSGNSSTRQLTTLNILNAPTVITLDAINITTTSARLRGRISLNGGAEILERRFDWGTGGSWTDWTANVNTSGNDFYFDLTGLDPGRTYNFRAWARNSVGWSFSAADFFTTTALPSAPAAPVMLTATGVGETGFTARWNASSGATNYCIDVGTGTGYAQGITMAADDFEGAFPSAGWVAEGGIIKTTTYARAGSHSVRFSANAHALVSPVVTNPSGVSFWTRWTAVGRTTIVEWVQGNATGVVGEVVSTVANSFEEVGLSFTGLGEGQFRFRRGNTATVYIDDINIMRVGTAAAGYKNRSVGNVTSFQVTGLLPGTLYYYRVRAEGEGGNSPNPANQTVTTLTPPPPPAPPSAPVISAATNITAEAFDFSWTPVNDATYYALDVATSADFTPGTLAFDESFEGAFPPEGWSHETVDQSTTQKRTGSFSALINANGDRLITPEVANPSRLTFWTRWTAAGRDTAVEWVQGSLTTRVATVTSTVANNFEENTVYFRNLGTGRFQFLRSGTTASVYIDDVSLLVDGSTHPGYDARAFSGVASATVTGLTESTTYFYRLRAGNDVGLSDYSMVRELETPVSAVSVVTNAPVAIPRQWLEHHFGADHYVDDVVTNRGENGMMVWHSFVAGLNPNDPASVLASEARMPAPGQTRPVIQWMGTDQPGRRYSVFGTTNLMTPFAPIATNLPNRHPAMNVHTDNVFNAESGPVYYRIRVDLEP